MNNPDQAMREMTLDEVMEKKFEKMHPNHLARRQYVELKTLKEDALEMVKGQVTNCNYCEGKGKIVTRFAGQAMTPIEWCDCTGCRLAREFKEKYGEK